MATLIKHAVFTHQDIARGNRSMWEDEGENKFRKKIVDEIKSQLMDYFLDENRIIAAAAKDSGSTLSATEEKAKEARKKASAVAAAAATKAVTEVAELAVTKVNLEASETELEEYVNNLTRNNVSKELISKPERKAAATAATAAAADREAARLADIAAERDYATAMLTDEEFGEAKREAESDAKLEKYKKIKEEDMDYRTQEEKVESRVKAVTKVGVTEECYKEIPVLSGSSMGGDLELKPYKDRLRIFIENINIFDGCGNGIEGIDDVITKLENVIFEIHNQFVRKMILSEPEISKENYAFDGNLPELIGDQEIRRLRFQPKIGDIESKLNDKFREVVDIDNLLKLFNRLIKGTGYMIGGAKKRRYILKHQ